MARMNTKDTSAAVVTIHGAGDLTPTGRKAIAAWLSRQARFVESHGKNFSKRFVARLR